jgi:NAD(P)-dependent dehydrogenase (short-subunit alcohol dehydrogenase family)
MADASESIAVLVLGSVHRTGGGVLRKLIREGCTVVVANRIPNHAEAERETYQVGPIDLTNSTALRGQAEDLRRRTLGPDKYFNVVIYNGVCLFPTVYVPL